MMQMKQMATNNTIVILNNIRSNQNVGSIFRTADAVGVSKIILVGYTPTPTDRFGRENKGLTKASLGAEKFVKWEKIGKLSEVINKLKNQKNSSSSLSTHNFLLKICSARSLDLRKARSEKNFSDFLIIGIEQNKKAIDYRKIKNLNLVTCNSNLALVFGNEVDGLSKEDLKLCDMVAQLPMLGKKESLNVAVCAGIVLYSLITN